MEKLIPIQDSQFKTLATFLTDHQKKVKQEIDDYKSRLAQLQKEYEANEATIRELQSSNGEPAAGSIISDFKVGLFPSNGHSTPNKGYKAKWSLWEKIKYLLETEERLLSSKELIDLIFQYQPELRQASEKEQRKIKVTLYSILTTKNNNNFLNRVGEPKEYKYGLFSWFEKDGVLKKQFDI